MSDEGPVQLNLYGIRYFVNGDLSNPYVKKLMVEARNDLQQMKDRNINNIDHIWLNKPNAYKIVSQFGQDSVYIDVPVFGEEKGKEEEVIEKQEEKESYRFVPAIVLCDISLGEVYYYYARVAWQETGDISVCDGAYWTGVIDIVKNSPTCDVPNEIYDDGIIYDKLEVLACRNWGNRDFYLWWDSDDDSEIDIDEDSLFIPGPIPWLGYSTDGAKDYLKSELTDIKGVVSETGIAEICDQYTALMSECEAEGYNTYWNCTEWNWSDGWCVEYTETDPACCKNEWRNSGILARTRCGTGHLYFEYKADSYQERHESPGVGPLMGLCMGYSWNCDEFVHTEAVIETTRGSGQLRTREQYQYIDYPAYAAEDYGGLYRTEGDIINFNFDFGYEYSAIKNGYMTAPCETNQVDTYDEKEVYIAPYGLPGAYIQDIGDPPEYICPTDSFHNLYMLLFIEHVYETAGTVKCSPWAIEDYGYDAAGVYDHGVVNACLGSTPFAYYRTLCINLNGVRIEIDRTEEYQSWSTYDELFYVTDSLILDFMGTPVYMYGYIRILYTHGYTGYSTIYTRYGYFLNDIHYQSEIFYPADVLNTQGRTSPLHDVFGSAERNGKYGFGQCAGFVVKEKRIIDAPKEYREKVL